MNLTGQYFFHSRHIMHKIQNLTKTSHLSLFYLLRRKKKINIYITCTLQCINVWTLICECRTNNINSKVALQSFSSGLDSFVLRGVYRQLWWIPICKLLFDHVIVFFSIISPLRIKKWRRKEKGQYTRLQIVFDQFCCLNICLYILVFQS
jgi:hypothetical protein